MADILKFPKIKRIPYGEGYFKPTIAYDIEELGYKKHNELEKERELEDEEENVLICDSCGQTEFYYVQGNYLECIRCGDTTAVLDLFGDFK